MGFNSGFKGLNPALDGGGPEVVTNILLGAFGKTAF